VGRSEHIGDGTKFERIESKYFEKLYADEDWKSHTQDVLVCFDPLIVMGVGEHVGYKALKDYDAFVPDGSFRLNHIVFVSNVVNHRNARARLYHFDVESKDWRGRDLVHGNWTYDIAGAEVTVEYDPDVVKVVNVSSATRELNQHRFDPPLGVRCTMRMVDRVPPGRLLLHAVTKFPST
jgi:hypothetical protein